METADDLHTFMGRQMPVDWVGVAGRVQIRLVGVWERNISFKVSSKGEKETA